MKTKFTLLFSLAFIFAGSIQAQVFVKHDASGANDGSSWADAYTDLDIALTSSSQGDQVWVAAGTYRPGGDFPTVNSFFTFPHDLELYGGFSGTESNLSERDWDANETILSGDHNGDDVNGNFNSNRTDNSLHVMWLTDTVTSSSTVDGFTVRNGNTLGGSASENDRRGGAILSYGAPAIRNCYFTQNYGWFGGAVYPRGAAAHGVIIEGCEFEENRGQFGAGIYLNSTTGTVHNCVFDNNESVSLGGAFYNNSAQGTMITDCEFTNNRSLESRGGGLYNSTSPSTISNCEFIDNSAGASSGGGMQVRHTSDNIGAITVNVSDCIFMGNNATFGGAFGSYDRLSIVNISNCEFEENSSANVGGALSNAFGARTNIEDCLFSENASGTGGAIYSQNDSSIVNVNTSTFSLNAATTGGGIAMSGDNEPSSVVPIPELTIQACYFIFNTGTDQGGAINMSNGIMTVENTLIDNNITSSGIGGGISLNTSDSIKANFSVINCTLTNNSADVGAGISHWKPGPEASSDLVLQNNIFYNPSGNDYDIEDGDPTLISNGGNLSEDASMTSFLSGPNDLTETDPLFIDFEDEDYHLQAGSPCVDAGIATGAPTTDIEGLDRVGEPDMGAFEYRIIGSVFGTDLQFGQLDISPNPVGNNLSFTFESTWRGPVEVRIVSMEGKVVFMENIEKGGQIFTGTYSVNDLSSGQYELMISTQNGELINSQPFLK